MRKNIKLISSVAPIFATLAVTLVLLLSSTATVIGTGEAVDEKVNETRSDDYLTAAFQSQIENLNPLTIQDVWSAYAARGPIYGSMSGYHPEEPHRVVPYAAYDWSPIGESGSGDSSDFDPDGEYEDPDPDTVANEAIPSGDLEVVTRIREDIKFHRSDNWYDSGQSWTSPYSDFQVDGEKMEEVTAHDIVFSAEMLQWEAPLYQSGFLPLNQTTTGTVDDETDENWVVNGGDGMYGGCQMIDDYSIKWELDEPYAMFYTYSFPMIMPMNVWDEHNLVIDGDDSALQWDCGQGDSIEEQKRSIVGTGPFMWTEWDKGSYIQLDTNPDYHYDGTLDKDRPVGYSLNGVDERPDFKGIDFQIRSTTSSAVMSLRKGEVDTVAWALDPGSVSDIKSDPETDVITCPDFGFFYMGFNMRKPAYGYKDYPGAGEQLESWYGQDISKKFRQAVAHASDKSHIVNNILQGMGKVGDSVVSPDNSVYYNSTVESYSYNLDKAEDLLVEQNEIWRRELDGFDAVWNGPEDGDYPLPRESGDTYEADTDKVDILTPTADYDPVRAQAGQYIANDLQDLGLNVDAKGQNFQSLTGRLDPGVQDFEMYVLGWSIGGFESLGSIESFFHSRNDKPGGYNMPGFRNETLDNLVEKAEKQVDQDDRAKTVKHLQGVLSKALPYNVLFFRDQVNGYRNEWEGWVDWPGGIWNGFSWANVHKAGEGSGLTMDLPSTEMVKGESQTVTISLTDGDGPVEGEPITLSVGNENATFETSDNVTDSNGEVEATITAPSEISDIISLYISASTSSGDSVSKSITVYDEELPQIIVDAEADISEIDYDEEADITIELSSSEGPVTNANISGTITPTTGGANLDPVPPIHYDGNEVVVSFSAPQVAEGETQDYTIEFQASGSGLMNGQETVEITVEHPSEGGDDNGGGDDDDNGDGDDSPALGILPLLMIAAFIASVYEIYRRKRHS